MVAAAGVVLTGLLWLLTSDRTSPLSASPDDQTTLETIRLAFYAVAGLGGVIALTVAYRKQRLNEGESEREGARLFNERFAAAAEQLSSERAANRLAGVYAMAALGDEWDAGRQTCVNVLCAYLRMPYEAPPPRHEREEIGFEAYWPVVEERLVRHTLLSAIAERMRAEPIEGQTWHRCDFDFTGATLDEADFDGAVFKGKVKFNYARFPRGSFDFGAAKFMGPVSFRRAHFTGGRFFFDGTEYLDDCDFTEVNVSGGALYFRYTTFRGDATSFSGSNFVGGTVLFEGCEFAPAGRLRFDRAAFAGSQVSFTRMEPGGTTLSFADPAVWTHPPSLDESSMALVPGLRPPEPFGEASAIGA
jgi:uncharacterized protein YjbI with pentapeptide repeats